MEVKNWSCGATQTLGLQVSMCRGGALELVCVCPYGTEMITVLLTSRGGSHSTVIAVMPLGLENFRRMAQFLFPLVSCNLPIWEELV